MMLVTCTASTDLRSDAAPEILRRNDPDRAGPAPPGAAPLEHAVQQTASRTAAIPAGAFAVPGNACHHAKLKWFPIQMQVRACRTDRLSRRGVRAEPRGRAGPPPMGDLLVVSRGWSGSRTARCAPHRARGRRRRGSRPRLAACSASMPSTNAASSPPGPSARDCGRLRTDSAMRVSTEPGTSTEAPMRVLRRGQIVSQALREAERGELAGVVRAAVGVADDARPGRRC